MTLKQRRIFKWREQSFVNIGSSCVSLVLQGTFGGHFTVHYWVQSYPKYNFYIFFLCCILQCIMQCVKIFRNNFVMSTHVLNITWKWYDIWFLCFKVCLVPFPCVRFQYYVLPAPLPCQKWRSFVEDLPLRHTSFVDSASF